MEPIRALPKTNTEPQNSAYESILVWGWITPILVEDLGEERQRMQVTGTSCRFCWAATQFRVVFRGMVTCSSIGNSRVVPHDNKDVREGGEGE